MLSKYALVLLLVVLLGVCETIHAGDAVASPRLKLFTIFSMDDVEIAANLSSSKSSSSLGTEGGNNFVQTVNKDAVTTADSDFILISSVILSEAGVPPLAIDGYQSTDSKQILYQKEHWKLIQEGSSYEVYATINGLYSPYHQSLKERNWLTRVTPMLTIQGVPFMWARFQSTAVKSAIACLAVAQWNESWNGSDDSELTTTKRAASLITYVNGSCKTEDTVALALTSPASSGVVDYFEGKVTANKPGRMVEASHVLQQQQYLASSSVTTSNLPSATSGRLFLRLQDTMCIDKAATPVTSAGVSNNLMVAPWEALALELCSGSDCQICKPSSLAGSQTSRSTAASKHIVAIVLSCSVFITASMALFYFLFRRHFFAPDERSKEEKELTTNLAYVLRI